MKFRLALAGAMSMLALAVFPSAGSATFIPGPNGKIAFASGRGNTEVPSPLDGEDNAARIWVADYPSGTPQQVTFLPAGVQHRHPNWSPDHTQIVYAAGTAFAGPYALWIVDLRTGESREFAPAAPMQDRPTWSPDGQTIAYGSNGDLWIKNVAPGSEPVKITDTPGIVEERPVWSPDGETLYYNRGEPAKQRDIYSKSPLTLAGAEIPIVTGATDDWQPSLSPDGKRLCFLRGPQSDGADLFTVNTNGTGVVGFSTTSLTGDLNCVWSPDGSRILYTLGAFSAGELFTRDINGNNPTPLNSMNVEKHFDGNADWATNFPPKCDSKSVHTGVNQFVTVNLTCTDPDFGFGADPPTPMPLESDAMEISMGPSHGAIGGLSNGKITYTPAKDFQGADSFSYTGTDGTSEAVPASVTVQVGNPPPGDTSAPSISAIKLSAKRWRLGNSLARISKAPVGTTISFGLNEEARASLTFQRAQAGRKSGKSCVKQTSANRSRPRCTRYVNAGSLNFSAKAGQNKVRFQGLVTRSRKLSLGTYRVVVGARDAAGNRSSRNGPSFTIVQG